MKSALKESQFFEFFAYYSARFITAPLWLAFVVLMIAASIATQVLDMLRDVSEFIAEQSGNGVNKVSFACHASAPFPLFRKFREEWIKADHERRKELFAKLKSGQPVDSELAESKEYARKLSIKVTDQGVEIQRLKGELEIAAKISDVCKRQEVELQHSRDEMVKLQRIKDAGDLLFDELDDKTPEADCKCFEFCPCYDCDIHGRSRAALKALKEAKL